MVENPSFADQRSRVVSGLISVYVLVLFLLVLATAYGQSTTYGRFVGTVEDQSGAVVPGVDVTATAKATNVGSPGVSDDRGNYLIDKLIPGLYTVKAELSGFKTQVREDVRLELTQVARVDFTMVPGEIAEQVTVVGQSTIIDTDAVEVAAVVEEKKILNLPLPRRDLLQLAYLATGGTRELPPDRVYRGDGFDTTFGGGSPAFNGLYPHSNQISLDGANNQSNFTQRPVVQATPETIQEFKVITNNYSAEYGRVGGAVISMLSKSGSNEFHGHAWYYLRDERFDAANFFTNKFGGTQLPVDYQVFGGSLGGSIIKDRTFFHAHYERFIDDLQQPGFLTVPSAAMTGGDLSGAGATGSIPQLYNPFDVVNGQRQPFDRNQIPRSLWNPISRKLMELIPPPPPNVSGVTDNNYSFARTNNLRITKYSIRGDHHFSGGDTLFGRFSWQDTPARNNFTAYPLPGADLNGALEYGSNVHHGGQSAVGWVNPVGPNLVGELSVSVWDFSWRRFIPVEDRDWAQELGYDDAQLHPVYNPDGSRGLGGLPTLSPRGYSSWFSAWNSGFGDKGFGLKYSLSGRRGNHYLKFGAEHTRNLDVTFSENLVYGGGQDLYDGYATGQILRNLDGTITGSDVGEPWADFMLGLPNWVVGNNLGLGYSFGRYNQSHYNAFINDDWKVGPNLTLNLDLRWEQPRPPYYEGSPDDRFPTDYQYCAFDFSRASDRIDPVQLMPRDFDIAQWQGPTSLAVPFENLPGRGCYEAKWSYFSPRFGLAWRLFGTNRTVLRLGAGLNYDQDIGILKVRSMIPALGRLNSIATRGFETPTIFTGRRLDLPTQVSLGEYRTCYFSELDWEEGHIYSYNLSIQHEVFQGTKLEIGYVGNQGRHMRGIGPFNVAMPEGYVVPLIGGGTATLTSDPITAGPRPWIPGDTADRVWSGQRARRPYPQVVPDAVRRSDRNSNYNSLQAKLERRF